MRAIETRYLFAMTAILFLAFAFGAYGLNIDIIWGDEIWSLAFMGAFDPPLIVQPKSWRPSRSLPRITSRSSISSAPLGASLLAGRRSCCDVSPCFSAH